MYVFFIFSFLISKKKLISRVNKSFKIGDNYGTKKRKVNKIEGLGCKKRGTQGGTAKWDKKKNP